MPDISEVIRHAIIEKDGISYSLLLIKESDRMIYPGMLRYILNLHSGDILRAEFRTNTYEYSPTVPLEASEVAIHRFEKWKTELEIDHRHFIEYLEGQQEVTRNLFHPVEPEPVDAVIIQGSPRPDGNCSIFAGWAADILLSLKMKVSVIYLDDLEINPCIGCYQCYNYGYCVFPDDMREIIESVRMCSLLVICSPVYTNTVPGSLKLCMDRFQAYHAMMTLSGEKHHPKGLLFAVAGRKGLLNFNCLVPVVDAFMGNIGIRKSGQILVDNIDEIRDIRNNEGLKDRVEELVKAAVNM